MREIFSFLKDRRKNACWSPLLTYVFHALFLSPNEKMPSLTITTNTKNVDVCLMEPTQWSSSFVHPVLL
jgi:hypothetical protein